MFGQLIERSSDGPVRKRRRPALSCIECRRRKIKCDRNLPCNHCKQTKNSECVYKDLHAVNTNRRLSGSKNSTIPKDAKPPSEGAIQLSYPTEHCYQLNSQQSSPQSTQHHLESSSEKGSSTSIATSIDCHPNNGTVLAERIRRSGQHLVDGMLATDEEIQGTKWQRALGVNFSTFNDIIVEDGANGVKLRTKFFNQSDMTPIKELKGCMSKTRFFGQSHWMNSFEHFHRICSFTDQSFITNDSGVIETNAEVRRLIERCKNEARKVKAERSVKWHKNPDFRDYIPPRETADHLVNLYLRTMEGGMRILHIPQFLREYESFWANPEKAAESSLVKILLVMAIGVCFYQEPNYEELHASALQWVYSAQSWVSAPFEKGRLNLSGLQIHCLLILARQTTALGGDLMWIAAGTLVRTAFQLGLHRDPKWFPKLSVMHAELRRRLWATVVELALQLSLDTGMPPLLSINDFDTEPPANINDEDISETTLVLPVAKPAHVYTQTSLQIQLLRSFRARLHISNIINDIHSETSYDETLRMSTEITQYCKEMTLLINSYPKSLLHPSLCKEMTNIFKTYPTTLLHPSRLQTNLVDMVLRRYLLTLHRPFAAKSHLEPRYYYSRKMCLDTAMIILSHTGSPESAQPLLDSTGREIMDDFTRLSCVGGGYFREILLYPGVLICVEVIVQLEEETLSGLPPSPSSAIARQPLLQIVDKMTDLLQKRFELGENNVKGLMFLAAARGQIEALISGAPLEKTIIEHARNAAKKYLDILQARKKTPDAFSSNGLEIADGWSQGVYTGDQNLGYDFTMQDASEASSMSNFNFDIPDSWLFAGWGDDNNPSLF